MSTLTGFLVARVDDVALYPTEREALAAAAADARLGRVMYVSVPLVMVCPDAVVVKCA